MPWLGHLLIRACHSLQLRAAPGQALPPVPGLSTQQKPLSRIVCQLYPESKSRGSRQAQGSGQRLVGTMKPHVLLTTQATLAESLNAFELHLLAGNLKALHASWDSCWEDIIHRKEV